MLPVIGTYHAVMEKAQKPSMACAGRIKTVKAGAVTGFDGSPLGDV